MLVKDPEQLTLPTEAELEAAIDALADVVDRLAEIGYAVKALVNISDDPTAAKKLPAYPSLEDIGRLAIFAPRANSYIDEALGFLSNISPEYLWDLSDLRVTARRA